VKRSYMIAGLLVAAAVAYLLVSNTGTTANFFLTIEEFRALGTTVQNRSLTVSGAVIGESIHYDPSIPQVTFTIVQIPGDPKEIAARGGLANVLAAAVNDPGAARMDVVYGGVKPDLLQHEAQAIVRGHPQSDGSFYADDLLLKCPSRYAEDIPAQIED
jgi:cytochrome c-type biogenesis protein CcmE